MKILNLRDISATSDKKMKRDLIFRSANPDKLNDKQMKTLGIKTIIDLRGETERKNVRSFKDVKTVHLPIDCEKRLQDKVKPLLKYKNIESELSVIITAEYIGLIENEKHIIKQVFSLLKVTENYPLLIHCRAGKDRTGFIVALIQMLMGFSDSEIVNDYLLSNKYYLPAMKKKLKIMKILSLGTMNTKNYEYILSSHKKNIEIIAENIVTQYKTIDKYLESCGVGTREITEIRRLLKAN